VEASETNSPDTSSANTIANEDTNDGAGTVTEFRPDNAEQEGEAAADISGENQIPKVADKANTALDGAKAPLSEAEKLKKAAAESLKKEKEKRKNPDDDEENIEDDELEDGLY